MKATGIVRRIDELGRVVIPKEIRRTQRIRRGDPLEIGGGTRWRSLPPATARSFSKSTPPSGSCTAPPASTPTC